MGDTVSASEGGLLSPPETDPDPVLMLDVELSRCSGIATKTLKMQKKSPPPVTWIIAISSRRIACQVLSYMLRVQCYVRGSTRLES